MSRASLRIHAVTVGVAVAILTAACGAGSPVPGPAQAGLGASLEKAAKKEGQLVLYASVEENAVKAVGDAFKKKYGVDVQVVRLTSSQLSQRFAAEAEAGAPVADFMLISRTGFTGEAVKKGWLTPLADAKIPGFPGNLPKKFLLPGEGTAVVTIQLAGIAYNTDLVPAADAPKTFEDVLNPKYKGMIAIANPASSASYLGEWYVVGQKIGSNFLTRMGAQRLKVYSSGVPAAAAVAAGEVAISVMGLESHIMEPKAKGAPIKFFIPDVTSGAEVVIGISAKAKNPSAARLLAQYLTSEEGSRVLSKAAGSVSPYSANLLPRNYLSPDLTAGLTNKDTVLTQLGVK